MLTVYPDCDPAVWEVARLVHLGQPPDCCFAQPDNFDGRAVPVKQNDTQTILKSRLIIPRTRLRSRNGDGVRRENGKASLHEVSSQLHNL